MAKKERDLGAPPKIHQTVRHAGQLYLADNDMHAAALAERDDLHPESIERLLKGGVISGGVFESKVEKAEKAQAEDEKKGKAYADSDLPAGMPGRLLLVNNGFDKLSKVREASDATLMDIKGMNADTLGKIREVTA